MRIATLQPTPEDTYRIVYDPASHGPDFESALQRSLRQQSEGDIEGACNTRFRAFQHLAELIPEDTETELDWEDHTTQSALVLLSFSAVDHFLAGDFEMCAAMLEMLLELDPEDHLEATKQLAYCYVALEEWELFDEIINDISDKYPEKAILKMWYALRREGRVPEGEAIHFHKSFPDFYTEFTATQHPADEQYLKEIESPQPSRSALARELWLQTEHLWTHFPGFPEALKAAAK